MPEVVLGTSGAGIIGGELAHASTAPDVARHDGDSGFVDEQAALHGGELAADRFAQKPGNPRIQILELHGVGHPAKALEGLANRTDIGEIHLNLDGSACEPGITAELQKQLVTVDPTPARVTDLDGDNVSVDGVAGVFLALTSGSDADVGNAENLDRVADDRQTFDQMGLNDGASAAAHHGQVHHQTKGFPVHQVGGGAVVST